MAMPASVGSWLEAGRQIIGQATGRHHGEQIADEGCGPSRLPARIRSSIVIAAMLPLLGLL